MTENPLSRIEFLVLRFDPRDASLAVVGDCGYSASNHADAMRDARQAAADSAPRRGTSRPSRRHPPSDRENVHRGLTRHALQAPAGLARRGLFLCPGALSLDHSQAKQIAS